MVHLLTGPTFALYLWYNIGKYIYIPFMDCLGIWVNESFIFCTKKRLRVSMLLLHFFRLQQDCGSRSTLDSRHTPTCRFSAKQPANARNWTKHPRAAPELPNCHRHSLHDPRKRQIHLPESQQRRVLWLESAWRPWADLQLRNCHRHSLQHPR